MRLDSVTYTQFCQFDVGYIGLSFSLATLGRYCRPHKVVVKLNCVKFADRLPAPSESAAIKGFAQYCQVQKIQIAKTVSQFCQIWPKEGQNSPNTLKN